MQANRTSRRHSDHANVLAARRIVAAARRRRWFARRMRVWVGCGGRVLGRRGAVTTSGILGGRFSTFFLYLCSRANSAAPFLKPMLKLRIRAARRIEQSTDRPCTVRIVASRRILRSINGAN